MKYQKYHIDQNNSTSKQMNSQNTKNTRLQNQIQNLVLNPIDGCKMINHTNSSIDFQIQCEPSAPFYGDIIQLTVLIPNNYPHEKPTLVIKDSSRIFHPNISKFGQICHQVVTSDQPAQTIRGRLTAFIRLLSIPNSHNPNNNQAAKLLQQSPTKYYRKAQKIFRGLQTMIISQQDVIAYNSIKAVQIHKMVNDQK